MVPWTTLPFLSSIVTVSLFSFIRKLTCRNVRACHIIIQKVAETYRTSFILGETGLYACPRSVHVENVVDDFSAWAKLQAACALRCVLHGFEDFPRSGRVTCRCRRDAAASPRERGEVSALSLRGVLSSFDLIHLPLLYVSGRQDGVSASLPTSTISQSKRRL